MGTKNFERAIDGVSRGEGLLGVGGGGEIHGAVVGAGGKAYDIGGEEVSVDALVRRWQLRTRRRLGLAAGERDEGGIGLRERGSLADPPTSAANGAS